MALSLFGSRQMKDFRSETYLAWQLKLTFAKAPQTMGRSPNGQLLQEEDCWMGATWRATTQNQAMHLTSRRVNRLTVKST